MVRFNVRLEAAQPARADFLLSMGAIEETITVEGTAPLLSPDEASTETRVFHDEIERLPLNGRGLLALLELSPGANVTPATRGEAGQFTANGQRPNSNYFTVDGMSANTGVSAGGLPAQASGGVLPAMSAFGSLDSLMPLEAVEEFRVQTSNAAPDVSRLPGAVVALTSRSGSNEFHGSAVYRFRHELLAANDWFANDAGQGRAPLRMEDVSPSLGGPLRRDRTFFFLAYERMVLRGPYVWQQPVPSLSARQTAASWAQPALDLFPAPNGADLGNGLAQWNGRNIRPSSLHSGLVRMDQAITSRGTFFGRYNDSPSANEFGGTQVNRLDLRFQSLTMGLNVRPAAKAALDFRVNESQASAQSTWTQAGASSPAGCALQSLTSYFFGGQIPCDSLVRFAISGVGQVVSGSEGDRRQRQFQLLQSASLNEGRHALRFGFDYRRIVPIRRDATGTLSVIADDMAALMNGSSLWTARSAALSESTVVTEWALWAQDTWQVSRRLTVTPGLRWEFSPPPVTSSPVYFYDPVNNDVTQGQQPLWPASYRNFAPRLGAAYQLSRDGRTVLRGAAGLFYDSSLSIATDLINGGPLSISSFVSQMYAPFSTQLTYGLMPGLRMPRLRAVECIAGPRLRRARRGVCGLRGVYRRPPAAPGNRRRRQHSDVPGGADHQQRPVRLPGPPGAVPEARRGRFPGAGFVRVVALHRRRFERFLPDVGGRRGERGRRSRIFRFRLAPLFHGRIDLRVSGAQGGRRAASQRLGAGRHAARPDRLSHHGSCRPTNTWGSHLPMHSAPIWWRAHRSGRRIPTLREDGTSTRRRSVPRQPAVKATWDAIPSRDLECRRWILPCGASSGWVSGARSSSGWRHSTVSTKRTLRTR